MSLKDDLWIWGQSAGSHHRVGNNVWNLPGENRMESLEGAQYLGIPNICRVAIGDSPKPPFDAEAELLKDCPKVIWSVIGDATTTRTNTGGTDVQAVIDVSRKYPNIIGGVMDDLFVSDRMDFYTPEVIGECAQQLHENGLELWSVIYEYGLDKDVRAHLSHCDVVSIWTWCGENLSKLDETYENLCKLTAPGQKIYAGCYFWDYGNCRPLPLESMKLQLETYRKWYETGRIGGIVFCSNCIADIGLDTVEYTRKWIAEL